MTSYQIITIIAIIAGPILAVQAQKFIEKLNHIKKQKKSIFTTLMSTRQSVLSAKHVEALNLIDIVFYGKNKKNQEVIEAWRTYHDHLGDSPKNISDANYEQLVTVWNSKLQELLINLLHKMAISVGYNFDLVTLKKGGYTPQAYLDVEDEQTIIRKSLVKVLNGDISVPISVTNQK